MLYELCQSLRDGGELISEQTAAKILKHSLHHRERLKLRGREPKPWQFVALTFSFLPVDEPTALRIKFDRRAQNIFHLADQTEHGGARTFESRHQCFGIYRGASIGENRMDLENTVELVHEPEDSGKTQALRLIRDSYAARCRKVSDGASQVDQRRIKKRDRAALRVLRSC